MRVDTRVLIGAVATLSTAIGAAGGYYLAVRRLESVYDERLNEEITRTKDQYRKLHKEGEYADPENLTADYDSEEVREFSTLVKAMEYTSYNDIKPKEEPEVDESRPVLFNGKPLDENYDFGTPEPENDRESGEPFIITFDEFTNDNPHFAKLSLSYYVMDDTLVDDQDIPVEDYVYTVGIEGLEHFGEGSGDPNVVYIRNENTSTDFEITRNPGSFGDFVTGGELQHHDKVLRFRGDFE